MTARGELLHRIAGLRNEIAHTSVAARRERQSQELLEDLLSQGQNLPSLLEAVVLFVESELPGSVCSILLLDESGERLLLGSAPSLPDICREAFNGLRIGPAVGSCGTAAFTGNRVIAEDIETHPVWTPYRELMRRAGLRACWAEPILAGDGRVLGTFAIYHPRPYAPTRAHMDLISMAAYWAGVAIGHVRAEEVLRRREARLTEAGLAGRAGTWELDLKGNRLIWSRQTYRLLGLATTELPTARTFVRQCVYAEDRRAVRSEFVRAVEAKAPFNCDFRVVWPDGRLRWLHSRGTGTYDVEGKPIRFSGMFIDITEFKQARRVESHAGPRQRIREHAVELERKFPFPRNENSGREHSGQEQGKRALEDNESGFRRLVNSLPQLVWTCDTQGRCDFLSQQWLAYTGVPESLQMGYGWLQQVHPEDREHLMTVWSSAVPSGSEFHAEYRLRGGDGVYRSFDARAVRMQDAYGRTVKWVGTSTEVTGRSRAREALQKSHDSLERRVANRTAELQHAVERLNEENAERRKAEQALRDSEDRWKFALAATGAGIIDWNVATGGIIFSDRWLDMTGYRAGEVDNVDGLKGLVHPDDLAEAFRDVQLVLEGRETSHKVEHRLRCADGRWIWVEARALVTSRGPDGAPLRMIGTHVDVTGRKEAEEECRRFEARLQQTQHMESLGVLAGGIAHDFNSMLTIFLGYADLARTTLAGDSPARGFIDMALTSAKRAAELIDQILAYAGKGEFALSPVKVSTLVDEMAALLQISISRKVVVQYDFPPELPAIAADAVQIRRVIMNLLINASEAIGDRPGAISVTGGCSRCDRQFLDEMGQSKDEPEGMYVWLEVADNGCGMPAETREKIFDPFFSTKFTGRGLGLSAVLGIVRRHHGMITCWSEAGKGTRFKMFFPAVAQHGDTGKAAARAKAATVSRA